MNTTTGDRTAGLRAARTKDSHDKRRRVLQVINTLEANGTPITAAAVASAAAVSTWLVHADGITQHMQAARRRQAAGTEPPAPMPSAGGIAPVTPAGIRTDLAIAREEIRRLRVERDQLRGRLRLQLGAEIDGPDRAQLITRVADLETTGRKLTAERDARAAEAGTANKRVRELEDDLDAARNSLRAFIKDRNRTPR